MRVYRGNSEETQETVNSKKPLLICKWKKEMGETV